MFRKIHSNRDPNDTLYSEIKKEFGTYFEKADNWLRGFFRRYTWQVFTVMVIALLISVALSFTVSRNHENGSGSSHSTYDRTKDTIKTLSPFTNGFDQLLETTSALKETMALKQHIEAIIAKDHLSKADSTELEKALDRLQQIHQRINTHH